MDTNFNVTNAIEDNLQFWNNLPLKNFSYKEYLDVIIPLIREIDTRRPEPKEIFIQLKLTNFFLHNKTKKEDTRFFAKFISSLRENELFYFFVFLLFLCKKEDSDIQKYFEKLLVTFNQKVIDLDKDGNLLLDKDQLINILINSLRIFFERSFVKRALVIFSEVISDEKDDRLRNAFKKFNKTLPQYLENLLKPALTLDGKSVFSDLFFEKVFPNYFCSWNKIIDTFHNEIYA